MQPTDNASLEAILESIGQNLNQIRLKQNISNEDLAEKAGVSRVTLSKLWKGAPIKFDTLLRVIRAMGRMDLIHPLLVPPEDTPMERLSTHNVSQSEHPRLRVRKQRSSRLTERMAKRKKGRHLSKAPAAKPRSARR
ncbi:MULTISPECIES: helix-turn-helix domain-containing protein [unclassified Neptuniibacter]|uniref:helix-turn-helix domain-containing protein n=1 Tax=unclassified Neptuniibacter TaxID=2630693 RepID=UPI000C567826|nr:MULTISPECIES: helix-turn-helix domain-containing protein [unclassified Neptuniibacter]MAY43118.1 hypothetical protein [Oceanospirillaceae bacterium]|tara:strand:- start:2168 stop:2578 length:411 start_codon:yes stop_codon:yes gene_type:complete